MKPRLFIGSSSEHLMAAYDVQSNLERDADATVWDQDIFAVSQSTLDSLLQVLDNFDFGLFVFAPVDVTKLRGVEHQTVRDNVVFELGLFVGRLGRERSFLVLPRDIAHFHLPTDLLGIKPETYDPHRDDENLRAALGPACNVFRKVIRRLGPVTKDASADARGSLPRTATPDIPTTTTEAFSVLGKQVLSPPVPRIGPLPTVPPEYDEPDIISLLEAWMGGRPSDLNTDAIRYSDVDRELALPAGSARKYLEIAAKKYHYRVRRSGKETITFEPDHHYFRLG
jgi:hypothetical protein